MVKLGAPLVSVLENLDINSWDSHKKYNRFINGEVTLDYTPFNRIIVQSQYEDTSLEKIEKLAFRVTNFDERDYILESISCLRVGASRAAVVMIWNACIENLRTKCIALNKGRLMNEELLKLYPKSKRIKRIEDFEYVKDSVLLNLCCNIGILSKSKKDILINNCLSLRNRCGHPTDIVPDEFAVKAYIEDMIKIIFKE